MKLIRDYKTHYVLQDQSGKDFVVSKSGISEKLDARIKGYAQGGMVALRDIPSRQEDDQLNAQMVQQVQGAAKGASEYATDILSGNAMTRQNQQVMRGAEALGNAALGKPYSEKDLDKYSEGMASAVAGTINPVKGPKALPMDEASRMARATEMGFDPSTTWYHGTKADIEAFNPSALGASTDAPSARRGYFFTKDASTASDYADLSKSRALLRGRADDEGMKELTRLRKEADKAYDYWQTPDSYGVEPIDGSSKWEAAQDALNEQSKKMGQVDTWDAITDKIKNNKEIQNIRANLPELETKFSQMIADDLKSGADWSSNATWRKETRDISEKITTARKRADQIAIDIAKEENTAGANVVPARLKMSNPYVHDFEGETYRETSYNEILKKAKASGHDSVLLKNTYDPANRHNKKLIDVAVVFEPNQIRSKFAEFDPKKVKSGNISAGIGAVGAAGAAATSKESEAKGYTKGGVVGGNMAHKYLKEDDKAYFIKHPDGSEFKVAKKGLSGSIVKKIEAMKPKGYADGGVVQPPEELYEPEIEPSPVPGPSPAQAINRQPAMVPEPTPTGFTNQRVSAQDEGAPLEYEAVQPTPVAPPKLGEAQVQPAQDDLAQSYNLQKQAVTQIGNINQQQQMADAQTQQNYAKALEDTAANYKAQLSDLDKQNSEYKQAIMKGDINPQRLWGEMGTAQKVGMGIAFILGGIGQGLMKSGPNQAVTMFNKIVDDDIAAQRVNLGKKENLLSQNMQKYRDINTAEAATRMQLIAGVQAQLAMSASKSGSKLAIQNSKLANAKLDEELAKYRATLAQAKTKAMSEKTDQFIPQMREFAPSKEAANIINKRIADSNRAVSGLNSLLSFSSVPLKSFSPEMRAKASQEAKLLQGSLKDDIVGAGTVSDTDREMLKEVIADPTVMFSWDRSNIVRIQQLREIVKRNTNDTLRAYGMQPTYGVDAVQPKGNR